MISGAVGEERRRAALVLVVSALLVALVEVGTYLFDPELSGVQPSFGSGIDATTGGRVVHDFLADQDATIKAQTTGDQSQLEGYLTGNALQDVAQQVANNPPSPNATFNVRVQSLSVVQARDPNDPSVVIEVQEDAVKTLVTYPENAAPSEQTISFHGDYWMRESNGRYSITDQVIQNQPTSAWPALGLAALALVWVGAAGLLIMRTRSIRAPATAAPTEPRLDEGGAPTAGMPVQTVPVAPSVELVVRTFGGLHLMHDGKDWVQSLDQRPVTGFVWQRLLVGAIRDPAFHPSREELARQVSPMFDRYTQLKQMRNVVSGLRELPGVLRDTIVIEPQRLSFNLAGCDCDAIRLVNASAAVPGRTTFAPREVMPAQEVFDQSVGTFLPDFEKADGLATNNHPMSTDLIKEVREMLTGKRIELAVVLADTYLAGGVPAKALAVLEPTFKGREQRKDLADRLAAAYRGVGRDAEADALDARFM